MKDQKELGIGDFTAIPNGIGGVEHRMELMYQGVVNGEITLERWWKPAARRRRDCLACIRRRGDPARCRCRHCHLGSNFDDDHWNQQQAPHEHGPLSV